MAYFDANGADVDTEGGPEQARIDEGQPQVSVDAADQQTDDEVQLLIAKPDHT